MKNLNKIVLAGLLFAAAVVPQDAGAFFGLTTLKNGLDQIYAAAGNLMPKLSPWAVLNFLKNTEFEKEQLEKERKLVQTREYRRTMEETIRGEKLDHIKSLVKKRLDTYSLDEAADFAAIHGKLPILDYLVIECGANVCKTDYALYWAAWLGDLKRVKSYLQRQGNNRIYAINDPVSWGTALQGACRNGHTDVANFLLKNGADPNIKCDWDGSTALHSAARNDNLKLVELLIGYEADWRIRNESGDTAYWVAGHKCSKYLENVMKQEKIVAVNKQ